MAAIHFCILILSLPLNTINATGVQVGVQVGVQAGVQAGVQDSYRKWKMIISQVKLQDKL